jgi:hypothetical protein
VGVHVGATRQTEDDFEMTPEAERKRGPRAAGWNPTDTTRVFGMPRGVWNWRGTALVLLLVTVPQLITLTVGDGTESPAVEAARLSGLVTFPVVLGAAVLIYFHWRISGGTQTAWLAAGLTAVGVQGILLEGLRLAKPETVEKLLGWMMIVDLAFAAVLLLIVILAER